MHDRRVCQCLHISADISYILRWCTFWQSKTVSWLPSAVNCAGKKKMNFDECLLFLFRDGDHYQTVLLWSYHLMVGHELLQQVICEGCIYVMCISFSIYMYLVMQVKFSTKGFVFVLFFSFSTARCYANCSGKPFLHCGVAKRKLNITQGLEGRNRCSSSKTRWLNSQSGNKPLKSVACLSTWHQCGAWASFLRDALFHTLPAICKNYASNCLVIKENRRSTHSLVA